MERKMETRPPEIIERIVAWLIPPMSREHVLGDLSERYTSPRQYVLDAMRTLPFVIASRVRRTFNPGYVGMFAILFLGWSFPWESQPWIASTIAPITGVAVLILRDVYRSPATKEFQAAVMDVVCVALGVL